MLQDASDPRAIKVLHAAQQLLQEYASHIADHVVRDSFLAMHRELLDVETKAQNSFLAKQDNGG